MTTHSVTVDVPDAVNITLRGHARAVDTTRLPPNVIVALIEKGIQRGANDPLGALFKKGETVPAAKIDEYFTELTSRWEKGEVQKARTGGLGRTTDPVQREVKRLASAEVDNNLKSLLEHHNVSRREFDESLRSKYVAARIEKHRERLEKEAKANLAKLQRVAEPIELLDIDEAPAGESDYSLLSRAIMGGASDDKPADAS